jgi:CRP/FNR family transcriptional regulator
MPADSRTLAAMRNTPLLSRLDDAALDKLAGDSRTVSLPADRGIVVAGEQADRFFVILEGRVKVFQLSPRGDEQILHLYGPGRSVGEAAMWAGEGFPANARTVEPSRLLVISRQTLRRAIERNPELAFEMMAGLSSKLREFASLIEQLSLREVPARLASWLLAQRELAGSDQVRLRQTKKALAGQLGTVPETLSRALKRLSGKGLIDVAGAVITIRDAEGLAAIAGQ